MAEPTRLTLDIAQGGAGHLAAALLAGASHARQQGEALPTRQEDEDTERYHWLTLAAQLRVAARGLVDGR